MFALTYKGEPDRVEFTSCVQPTGVISPVEMINLAAGLRLVEYDSSDESDPENMEVSQDKPGASLCENSRFSALTCETSARAVRCLSELREVVTRLQTKKLFSYNPSSLLKLLAQVENCSQQSHLSHFIK